MERHDPLPGTDSDPSLVLHGGLWFQTQSCKVDGPLNQLPSIQQCPQRTLSNFDNRSIELANFEWQVDLNRRLIRQSGALTVSPVMALFATDQSSWRGSRC